MSAAPKAIYMRRRYKVHGPPRTLCPIATSPSKLLSSAGARDARTHPRQRGGGVALPSRTHGSGRYRPDPPPKKKRRPGANAGSDGEGAAPAGGGRGRIAPRRAGPRSQLAPSAFRRQRPGGAPRPPGPAPRTPAAPRCGKPPFARPCRRPPARPRGMGPDPSPRPLLASGKRPVHHRAGVFNAIPSHGTRYCYFLEAVNWVLRRPSVSSLRSTTFLYSDVSKTS